MAATSRNVYTVGQINQYIKAMFAQDFLLQRISVKGEVSNCKYHSSGHIYFTLKDAGSAIRCVMFASSRGGLKFRMNDGDRVVVTGSVETYERDGTYQLYARVIEQDGLGSLYQQFLALKAELEEMGMFAPEYKQPIPRYAKRVGIVTAATGAAIHDICNVSFRRNPHVELILCPAQVQGEGAAESVADGIRRLDALGLDVMIVGRGGGSIEDLWAFNEEVVARAIFECRTPVISAVGHETDTTIADYVADLRAPTPSAAAELAVFDYWETKRQLQTEAGRLTRMFRQQLGQARQQCEHYRFAVDAKSPQNRLHMLRQRLRNADYFLRVKSPGHRLPDYRQRLADGRRQASDRIRTLLAQAQDGAKERKITLSDRIHGRIQEEEHRLSLLAARLEGVSPLKQLQRGYAYVQGPDGHTLHTVAQVRPRDALRVHLVDGVVQAEVVSVEESEQPA